MPVNRREFIRASFSAAAAAAAFARPKLVEAFTQPAPSLVSVASLAPDVRSGASLGKRFMMGGQPAGEYFQMNLRSSPSAEVSHVMLIEPQTGAWSLGVPVPPEAGQRRAGLLQIAAAAYKIEASRACEPSLEIIYLDAQGAEQRATLISTREARPDNDVPQGRHPYSVQLLAGDRTFKLDPFSWESRAAHQLSSSDGEHIRIDVGHRADAPDFLTVTHTPSKRANTPPLSNLVVAFVAQFMRELPGRIGDNRHEIADFWYPASAPKCRAPR